MKARYDFEMRFTHHVTPQDTIMYRGELTDLKAAHWDDERLEFMYRSLFRARRKAQSFHE